MSRIYTRGSQSTEVYNVSCYRWMDGKRYAPHLLHFKDIGIDDRIAEVRIWEYAVYTSDLTSNDFFRMPDMFVVPILRISTAYRKGDTLILSQVIGEEMPPVMGSTAFVSPPGEALMQNEADIAINAALMYAAEPQQA